MGKYQGTISPDELKDLLPAEEKPKFQGSISPDELKGLLPDEHQEQKPSTLDQVKDAALRFNPITGPAKQISDLITGEGDSANRVRSAVSGATFGLAPKILAAAEDTALGRALDGEPKSEDEWKQIYGKAASEHPVENIAGGLAVPLPGAGAKGAAGVVTRIGGGALMGGAAGYAGAEKGKELEGAEHGALAGGALSGLGEVAAAKLGPMLREWAGKKAAKAIQGVPEIGNKLGKAGLKGSEDLAKFGNEAMDQGLVGFGDSPRNIEEKIGDSINKHGSAIGAADEAALAAGGKLDKSAIAKAAEGELSHLNPTAEAQSSKAREAVAQLRQGSREEVLQQLIKADPSIANMGRGAQDQLVEQMLAGQPNTVPDFAAMRTQLKNIRDSVSKSVEPPLSQQLLKSTKDAGSAALNEQVTKALPADKQAGFQDALKKYAFAKRAAELNQRAVTREAGHSLPVGSAIAAGLVGGPAAAVGVVGHHLVKNRYDASLAALARLASKAAPAAASVAPRIAPITQEQAAAAAMAKMNAGIQAIGHPPPPPPMAPAPATPQPEDVPPYLRRP